MPRAAASLLARLSDLLRCQQAHSNPPCTAPRERELTHAGAVDVEVEQRKRFALRLPLRAGGPYKRHAPLPPGANGPWRKPSTCSTAPISISWTPPTLDPPPPPPPQPPPSS